MARPLLDTPDRATHRRRGLGARISSWRIRRGLDDELRALMRQVRLDRLRQRLAAAPIEVTKAAYRTARDRATFDLADGSALALRLYWPCRAPVCALEAMSWDDSVGWTVTARTGAGERVVYYAWLASCEGGDAMWVGQSCPA